MGDLSAYLQARAAWMPDDRACRRQRRYSGSGPGEKANDRLVARRQKNRGMQGRAQTSDTVAALRTLRLNEGWACDGHERKPFMRCAA